MMHYHNPLHIVILAFISYTQGKTRYGSNVVLEKRTSTWSNKKVVCHHLKSFPLNTLPMSLEMVLWILYSTYKIIRLNKRQQCHVILCSSHDFFNLCPAFVASKVLKIPYAVIVHHLTGAELSGGLILRCQFRISEGFKKSEAFIFGLISIINHRILHKSKNIVAVSTSTRNQLSRIGIQGVKVIYNGIEGQLSLKCKRIIRHETVMYDAVSVGRLSPDRGIFDLIEIWKIVSREEASAKLLIIGGGLPHYIQKLVQLIKVYNLDDNVTLAGVVGDTDKFFLMSQSKIFVLPSHNEGFCLSISEALFQGLPVITYELPAILEVYGKCPSIFYVKKGTYEKFAETVLRLLRSEDGSRQVGETGVDFINTLSQRFSWKNSSNELLILLRSISFNAKDYPK